MKKTEFEEFDDAVTEQLSVPHNAIKAKLDAELRKKMASREHTPLASATRFHLDSCAANRCSAGVLAGCIGAVLGRAEPDPVPIREVRFHGIFGYVGDCAV